MDTPLDVAAEIGKAVHDARNRATFDTRACADDILSRHPEAGVTRHEVAEAIASEADAAGLRTG